MPPRTKYADSGGHSIAYQTVGDGPVDILFVQGMISHLDLQWCDPLYAAFLRRLAGPCRLILMDQRGVGLSDASDSVPSIDERASDMAAVAEAVGAKKMFIMGQCHGGPPAIVYAASHPERVAGLILMSTFAKGTTNPDEPGSFSEADFASWMRVAEQWGEGRSLAYFMPSRDEGRLYRQLYATFERAALSRGMARAAVASTLDIDVTAALQCVRVPTLVMHCTDDFMPVDSGKYLAASIPGADFIELEGADHAPFLGSGSHAVADHLLEFIGKHRDLAQPPSERFGAIVMTDMVASTETAARLGDEKWAELLVRHDAAIRDDIDTHHGECVQFTGDGYLAQFDSCEDALRCAAAQQRTAADFGLRIRCGVHAGGYQPAGQYAIGLTTVIASRLMDIAEGGAILVSDVVTAAVAGGGFEFGPVCQYRLKGIDGAVGAAELIPSEGHPQINRWRPDDAVREPAPRPADRLLVAGAKRFSRVAQAASRYTQRS
jgi:pimeloyl-ACP methyl ester carboxylesterase/class 3 adenylate cyclase